MFNRLVLVSLILVACSPAIAGTSICDDTGCLLIGNPPPGIPADDDGAVRAQLVDGKLIVDGKTHGSFNLRGATPVLGDWDGDGIDEPGAYANGVWLLQKGWEATSQQLLIHMPPLGLNGPDVVPLVGSWDGSSVDGIGLYDNGVFELYSDYGDLTNSTVIDFGDVANHTGTVWESMPFVGPVDQVMDRVGLSKGVDIAYAPHNGGASYDFYGDDTALVRGQLAFRGFLGALGYARPYVFDAGSIEATGKSGYVVGFRVLPGMESTGDNACETHGTYACYNGDISKPNQSGVIILPIVDPFR